MRNGNKMFQWERNEEEGQGNKKNRRTSGNKVSVNMQRKKNWQGRGMEKLSKIPHAQVQTIYDECYYVHLKCYYLLESQPIPICNKRQLDFKIECY